MNQITIEIVALISATVSALVSGFISWFIFERKFTFKKLYLERAQAIKELWKRINKRHEEIVDLKDKMHKDKEAYKIKLAKTAKNLILTRQYFEDNSIYFNEEIIANFRSFYAGLQTSQISTGDSVVDYDVWKKTREMKEILEKEFRKMLGGK